ncbi:unnamed protein product [Natator depressus]
MDAEETLGVRDRRAVQKEEFQCAEVSGLRQRCGGSAWLAQNRGIGSIQELEQKQESVLRPATSPQCSCSPMEKVSYGESSTPWGEDAQLSQSKQAPDFKVSGMINAL